jgi:hypothetical protein
MPNRRRRLLRFLGRRPKQAGCRALVEPNEFRPRRRRARGARRGRELRDVVRGRRGMSRILRGPWSCGRRCGSDFIGRGAWGDVWRMDGRLACRPWSGAGGRGRSLRPAGRRASLRILQGRRFVRRAGGKQTGSEGQKDGAEKQPRRDIAERPHSYPSRARNTTSINGAPDARSRRGHRRGRWPTIGCHSAARKFGLRDRNQARLPGSSARPVHPTVAV